MAIRTELVEVEEIFSKIEIDILNIGNEAFSFDNKIKSINSSNTKAIQRLQDCILHFRNARNKLRSFLKVNENKYIDPNLLNKMDEDIGRLDEDIDKKEKAILEKVDTLDFYEKSEKRNIKLNPLKNRLSESMESLVIAAISLSAKKWNSYDENNGIKIFDEEGKEKEKAKKDIHLYKFFLFQEMQPAAQSVGGFTRQEMKSFPKNITLHNPNPIHNMDESEQKQESEKKDKLEKDKEIESFLFEEEEKTHELF